MASSCGIADETDIRPDVEFNCGLNYDPFIFMEDNNKVYSE